MKGGSAQARTQRSDTSMKESKTDPKKVGEEESQMVLNKIIVKTNIPGESVGINFGFEQRGCREK